MSAVTGNLLAQYGLLELYQATARTRPAGGAPPPWDATIQHLKRTPARLFAA